ncbi:MAG: adenine phosphoribosyltransferase [Chthoniobacterales bacterium]
MTPEDTQKLYDGIRNIHDFPKPGILFKDITPILLDPKLFRIAINHFVERCKKLQASKIAGIDARGFFFAATVAYELGLGFVPVRKKGKLPFTTKSQAYALEYGEAEIEIHTDAFCEGDRVVLIDDLLATGGTANAAVQLIKSVGGDVLESQFLIELTPLGGRKKLTAAPVYSILSYDED